MAGIEVELFRDAMIVLLVLSLAILLFTYTTAQTLGTGNVNNATLQGLNTQINNVQLAGSGIGLALNTTIVANGGTFNVFEVALNGVWKFLNLLWAIIVLIFTDLAAIVIITYVVIPSILSVSALGSAWGGFIGLIFQVIISIIGINFAYVVAVMLGFRKHTGH